MGELSLENGEELIKIARSSIEYYFSRRKMFAVGTTSQPLEEKRGVFVTIETFPKKSLRGCIGYVIPTKPLGDATAEVAVSAAFSDRRFHGLKREEMDSIILDVTVLGPLKKLDGDPKEYPKKIEIGTHGIMVEHGAFSGLLLPQVAVENKWDSETFLSETCWKGGLSQDMWRDKETIVHTFTGQIFSEEKPNGKVKEIII